MCYLKYLKILLTCLILILQSTRLVSEPHQIKKTSSNLIINKICVDEPDDSDDIHVLVYTQIINIPVAAKNLQIYLITNRRWEGSRIAVDSLTDKYIFDAWIWSGDSYAIGNAGGKNKKVEVEVEFLDVNNVALGEVPATSFTLSEVSYKVPEEEACNLDNAYCYPSPARITLGDDIKFMNLTPYTDINIISPAGHIIKSLKADKYGRVLPPWDGKNDDGEIIGSGTYIVHLKNNKGQKKIFNMLVIQ